MKTVQHGDVKVHVEDGYAPGRVADRVARFGKVKAAGDAILAVEAKGRDWRDTVPGREAMLADAELVEKILAAAGYVESKPAAPAKKRAKKE